MAVEDVVDFLSDADNTPHQPFRRRNDAACRAKAAFAKGATMAVSGLWVIGVTLRHTVNAAAPGAFRRLEIA